MKPQRTLFRAPRHQLDLRGPAGDLLTPAARPQTVTVLKRSPLMKHRERCRKKGLAFAVTTPLQKAIESSPDESVRFYDSYRPLPTRACIEYEGTYLVSDSALEESGLNDLCAHPTEVLLEKNPLYVTRLEEERKAEAFQRRRPFTASGSLEHIDYKNDDKNNHLPRPRAVPRTSATNVSVVALQVGVHGTTRPGAPCLPGNHAETGSNATTTPVRSDRRRYQGIEPRAILQETPAALPSNVLNDTVVEPGGSIVSVERNWFFSSLPTNCETGKKRVPCSRVTERQAIISNRLSEPRSIRSKSVTDGVGKTVWDWIEYHAKESPGPGNYDDGVAFKKLLSSSGGRFNLSKSKSDLENTIIRAADTPGVGSYEEVRPKIMGGTIAKTSGKSDIEWQIHRAASMPGAGSYEIDNAKPKLRGGKFPSSSGKSDRKCFPRLLGGECMPDIMSHISIYPLPCNYQSNGQFSEPQPYPVPTTMQRIKPNQNSAEGNFQIPAAKVISNGRFCEQCSLLDLVNINKP